MASVFVFLAYGTTSLVARRLGAGDTRAALGAVSEQLDRIHGRAARARVDLDTPGALTVVGLPITGLIAYMLHAKTKAHAARTEAQQAAAAAEAQQHLTDADRDWMRRHNGQA